MYPRSPGFVSLDERNDDLAADAPTINDIVDFTIVKSVVAGRGGAVLDFALRFFHFAEGRSAFAVFGILGPANAASGSASLSTVAAFAATDAPYA